MKKIHIVTIYTICHFIVDLACATLVSILSAKKNIQSINLFIAIILYNFFAFAMQLPIGKIADKLNKNALIAGIGCLLVALAFPVYKSGIISCIIAGIGNSMFHVGGGIDVLNISDKKATLSGIFVSTGAMGIFLGGKNKVIGVNNYYIPIIILVFFAGLLFYLYSKIKNKVKNEKYEFPKLNTYEEISILCLTATVIIRSYVGLILAFEWKMKFILALISVFAVVIGKALGGILGDKIGFTKVSVISLIISAFLFTFSFNNSILGILAILFFNMTMPITLIILSNMLPKCKGTAFGILTLGLFIGYIPVVLGMNRILFNPIGLFIIVIISALILWLGIILNKKK